MSNFAEHESGSLHGDETFRILAVEDEIAYIRLLEEVLRDCETAYNVDSCQTIRQLKDRIPGKWDAILLDLNLPDSEGINTFRQVQRMLPDIPIVMSTGRDDQKLIQQVLREGAQDYIRKGEMNADMLDRAIQHAIDRFKLQLSLREKTRQLEVANKQSEFILENHPDAIIWSDRSRTIRYVNQAAVRLLEKEPEELLGSNIRLPVGADQEEINLRGYYGIAKIAHIKCMEAELEGEEGCLCFVRDITEEKFREERMLNSQKMQAVVHLAAGVAHEFNNILAVIQLSGGLLQRDIKDNEASAQLLHEILNACGRGSRLVEQMTMFSRLKPPKLQLIEVGKLLEELEPVIRQEAGHAVDVRVLPPERQVFVQADAFLLRRVISNIVMNASEAIKGENGRLEVKADAREMSAEAGEPARRYACLSFRDNGVGMDEATLSSAFEPFFTRKAPNEATGLGLTTSFKIMQEHKGGIMLDSTPGEGSEVTLFLPEAERPQTATPFPKNIGHPRVMLIDGDNEFMMVTKFSLESEGFDVKAAPSVKEADKLIEDNKKGWQLVIANVSPNDSDVLEFVEHLRRDAPGVEVLVLGSASKQELKEALALENWPEHFNYLAKPFPLDDLVNRVKAIMNQG